MCTDFQMNLMISFCLYWEAFNFSLYISCPRYTSNVISIACDHGTLLSLDASWCGWKHSVPQIGHKMDVLYEGETHPLYAKLENLSYRCVPGRRTWKHAQGRKTDNVKTLLVPSRRMWTIKLPQFNNPITIVNYNCRIWYFKTKSCLVWNSDK